MKQPVEFYLENALSREIIELPAEVDHVNAAVAQAERQARIGGGIWHVYSRTHLAQVSA